METSYMKLYKNIALRKNKIKSSKNSNQQLKKNKSLTYYHIEGQNNNLNNITDIKVIKLKANLHTKNIIQ